MPEKAPEKIYSAEFTDDDILRVEHLSLWICHEKDKVRILRDISFSVRKSERLAIAGESGAGKTMTMNAITSMIPNSGTIIEGKILYRQDDGSWQDLLEIPYRKRHIFISRQVSVILQDSINALNPNERIVKQWGETVEIYNPKIGKKDLKTHLLDRMDIFGVQGGEETLTKYPSQLSGGMRQRIAIAMALESPARIIIADEPTTSLDTITQRRTVDFIARLCDESKKTLLYISHNLAILQYMCDQVMILHNGMVVEQGSASQIFFHGKESYTKELVSGTLKIMGRADNVPQIWQTSHGHGPFA